MSNRSDIENPDPLLETASAARYLGIHSDTLANRRAAGLAPAYIKIGHLVKYRLSALREFLDSQTVSPAATADASTVAVA